jgi:shikimate dehydrogenase
MKKAAIIGHPVSHSLSPKLHGYWLKQYNIAGSYEAIDAPPEQVEHIIRNLAKNGFIGGNVTVPYKELALMLCDEVDDIAREVGAVNTLYYVGEKLCGTNTDVAGFVENMRHYFTPPLEGGARGGVISNRLSVKAIDSPPTLTLPLKGGGNKRAVILGAGGASRAVVVALKQLGFSEIIITNRTHEKAELLAQKHGSPHTNPLPEGEGSIIAVDWSAREQALEGADLLVNTTSLGLKNNSPLEISLAKLPPHALVTDIVYAPLITPLLAAAQARGLKTVDGLGMLLHQAAPGFELWFEVKPNVTEELGGFILQP